MNQKITTPAASQGNRACGCGTQCRCGDACTCKAGRRCSSNCACAR